MLPFDWVALVPSGIELVWNAIKLSLSAPYCEVVTTDDTPSIPVDQATPKPEKNVLEDVYRSIASTTPGSIYVKKGRASPAECRRRNKRGLERHHTSLKETSDGSTTPANVIDALSELQRKVPKQQKNKNDTKFPKKNERSMVGTT